MKLRNSLFRMMLCSASTLHLAVDAKIPVSGNTVLPRPGGKTTTVQGSQRPQFKAAPGSDGKLADACAGGHVAGPVTGNRRLDSAPPAAFNSGRLHWLDPSSGQDYWLHRDQSQGRTVRKGAVGIRTPTFAPLLPHGGFNLYTM
jgi:hypothetical protein